MHRKGRTAFLLIILLLLLVVIASVGIGAMYVKPMQVIAILLKHVGVEIHVSYDSMQASVVNVIRLPRIALAILTGATLAISGGALQGLFRNPLAEPTLIGVTLGASASAVTAIVFAKQLLTVCWFLPPTTQLSVITFLGALATTMLVYRLSYVRGTTQVANMLLAGVAVNAIAGAITGLLTFSANDAQLRNITFWNLGSLAGASWSTILAVLPFMLISICCLPLLSKELNILSLGEAEARHIGVRVERVKRIVIVLVTLGVGASVAVNGSIGFIGLVIPHVIRKTVGPDNKLLLPLSALLGAVLLLLADLLARTIYAPAELPVGIITALSGGPFFLYLIIKENKKSVV